MVVCADPSHHCWKDVTLAIVGTGLWSHAVLNSLIYKFAHIPWETAAGMEQAKAGMEEYLK
eukprot:12040142-Prorocentrum_lima.AAC.1